ncbi:unnamed protein product [Rotaria sp. Silwood1]|nr:unnamed protein product [Rotaria sp. Silwood1]CAF1689201.1 unnamed protein product [Rotaria sp. Silwood1]CAF3790150.1 unnamed protein product [Rotaria sp. Silwood1]CAF3836650.1 unnamed protein product [Rotaria sp. Silwood1]CAF4760437.1 unnamed protein product [Rotaria sp. Silwood1]
MGSFDRCLVDAPCSCTGVIAKDPAVKNSKDEKDIQRCFTAQQNEAVVQYALNNRPVKLVETGLEFGIEGFTNFKGTSFHPFMKYCRRYYPHLYNLDVFFCF